MTNDPVFQMLKEDLAVQMGSPMCKEYRKTHPNCYGCISEKACHEWVERVMIYTEASIYPEKYGGSDE